LSAAAPLVNLRLDHDQSPTHQGCPREYLPFCSSADGERSQPRTAQI
jgi:hypothetical protein